MSSLIYNVTYYCNYLPYYIFNTLFSFIWIPLFYPIYVVSSLYEPLWFITHFGQPSSPSQRKVKHRLVYVACVVLFHRTRHRWSLLDPIRGRSTNNGVLVIIYMYVLGFVYYMPFSKNCFRFMLFQCLIYWIQWLYGGIKKWATHYILFNIRLYNTAHHFS